MSPQEVLFMTPSRKEGGREREKEKDKRVTGRETEKTGDNGKRMQKQTKGIGRN